MVSISELCRKNFNTRIQEAGLVPIKLTEEDMELVKYWAKLSAGEMGEEKFQSGDSDGAEERFRQGLIAELAVSKYFGVKFDGSYPGGSRMNNIPDLCHLGLNIGVKASYVGKSVKINKYCKYPQIICQMVDYWKDYSIKLPMVYIMGVLKPEYISTYCSYDYIDNDNCRSSKVGFVDYHRLADLTPNLLNGYKFNIRVVNLLNNGITPEVLLGVADSCLYMEKKFAHNIKIKCVNIDKGIKLGLEYKKYSFRRDFQTENIIQQDRILEILSKDVIFGYGVSGLLHNLQVNYKGDKQYCLTYVDLADLIYMNSPDKAADLRIKWINDLYVWEKFLIGEGNHVSYKLYETEESIRYRLSRLAFHKYTLNEMKEFIKSGLLTTDYLDKINEIK